MAQSRQRRAVAPDETCRVPCFNKALVSSLRAELPDATHLTRQSELLQALGNTTRLRILTALEMGEELCVCDLAHVLGLSISAISHQLRLLRSLELVSYRNDGRMVYYTLAVPGLMDWVRRSGELLLRGRYTLVGREASA